MEETHRSAELPTLSEENIPSYLHLRWVGQKVCCIFFLYDGSSSA